MLHNPEKVTHAVFLAGGQGTRISELTTEIGLPKQLLVVRGTSSLGHGLRIVSSSYPDAETIIVSSPLWVRLFQEHFTKCRILVQPQPRGNADALRIATENIFDGENILCFNSDHLFGITPEELQQLTRVHTLYHFIATILLETIPSTETAKFYWKYDHEHNLKGRSRKLDARLKMNAGTFIGAFIAQLNWLRTATAKESKIAVQHNTEAKTTDMLLRTIHKTRIGVFSTTQKHEGVNTPQEYHKLQAIAN